MYYINKYRPEERKKKLTALLLYHSTSIIFFPVQYINAKVCNYTPGSQNSHMSQNQSSQKNGNKIIVGLLHDNLVI